MDRPLLPVRRPWFLTVITTAGLVSMVMAPVAAVGTWLLVTNPEVAGEVAADGSVRPLLTAIAATLGQMLVKALGYL